MLDTKKHLDVKSKAILSMEDFVSDLINGTGGSVEAAVKFVDIIGAEAQQLRC